MSLLSEAVEGASVLLDLELGLMPSQVSDTDFVVRSPEAPFPYGFTLAISRGYLAWHFEVTPDPDSRPLLAQMEGIATGFSSELEAVLEDLERKNFVFKVNGEAYRSNYSNYPWLDFEISGSIKDEVGHPMSPKELQNGIVDSLSIPVWFLDQIISSRSKADPGEVEGSLTTIMTNKYERSRVNRARCLAHYGPRCQGCGEDPTVKYGALGKDVVHIHHLTPLSLMTGPDVVDPLLDLVPLCPTCHNVVHRETPPVELERLREITGFKSKQTRA